MPIVGSSALLIPLANPFTKRDLSAFVLPNVHKDGVRQRYQECARTRFHPNYQERVAAHERELTRYAVRRLQRVPGLVSYGPSWQSFLEGKEDRLGVLSFNLEGRSYVEVVAILANEWGVGVRSGCFCVHQYVAQLLGISDEDSQEARERMVTGLPVELPGMVRASLGLASGHADIDRLIEGLQAIARGEIRATYVTTEHADHAFVAHGESLL